tara:strand:+ start:51 stop:941 length:891 start_codon:yes stop_codon:yes gene_type:complete
MKNSGINRRNAIKGLAAGTSAAFFSNSMINSINAKEKMNNLKLKGNIKQSVCSWCFPMLSLEELAIEGKRMGLMGIDLVNPKGFSTLKKHGLESTLSTPEKYSLSEGWNKKENHNGLIETYSKVIDVVADAGYKSLFCASGNTFGMDIEIGIKNCEIGIKKILSKAEKRNVTLVMELLNSKVNHPDYMLDKSEIGIELSKKIGSENFKLLYDIYHMQIMEGDIISTIKKNHQYFGHYHTAGVPGRNELDENQELYYPAIMDAILSTGFTGYVAQEFMPKGKDPMKSLEDAVILCDV